MQKNLGPQSILLCLSLLRRVLRRAGQLEMYPGPVPYFEMPKFDNKRVRFLNQDEAKTLLLNLSVRSELWHDISAFALHTGMRAGEIFSLTPQSINMESRFATILDTKNTMGRSVPINDCALNIVKKRVNCSTAYLFENENFPNKQLTRPSKLFREVVKSCHLNKAVVDRRHKVVFHTLRHTFASWLIQDGIPLMVVSQLLGHKTLTMTLRYAHLAPDQGRTAVERLPTIFFFDK